MKKVWPLLFVFLLFSPTLSQAHPNSGTSGLAFLKFGVGARPVAMGEAFVGLSDDVNALYWNPGGLRRLEGTEITFMHNRWFQDISYEFFGAGRGFGSHSLGVSLALNTVGDILYYEDRPTTKPLGAFSSHDFFLGLTYARTLQEKLDLGITWRWVYEKIHTNTAKGWAVDLGGIYRFTDWMSLGTTLQNLGPKLKFISQSFPLPTIFRAGIGLSSPHLSPSPLFTFDLVKPRDNGLALHLGAEYTLLDALSLRAGYQTGYEEKSFSTGFGLKYRNYGIDYAWVPYGSDLGNTHRFSFNFGF